MVVNHQVHNLRAIALFNIIPLLLMASVTVHACEAFTIEEATIDDIQRAFRENKLTSRKLVQLYINQIKTLNPLLRSVIEINPEAEEEAEKADEERRSGKSKSVGGELHGIPVMVKDGVATKDKMNTTAGSYALMGSVVAREGGVVEKLRKSGAVIIGKTSMSEWYKFRSLSHLPNAWCARAGQGVNPYYPEGDPCGSSSGSAISVAANMVTVSLGTETHSSIICPSDHNSVVGFKPTVGLTSRAGIVPVMPSLDTVGPITRTVRDAVYVLDVIAGFDPRDHEATSAAAKFIPSGGYKQFLNPNGLEGKRVGVVRRPFYHKLSESTIATFENHLAMLRQRGATVIDNLEIAHIDKIINPATSGELTLMKAEFKLAINDYLKELISSPVRSLADIIAFNENNPDLEKIEEYGQDSFIEAEKTNGIGEKEKEAIELMKELSRDGFEKLMAENELDAMVTAGSGAVSVLAIGGCPGITVPAGYDEHGMPFGICFGGLKGTEAKLIEIAYDFEQATKTRKKPSFPISKESSSEALSETA